jgi:hypothetical protein
MTAEIMKSKITRRKALALGLPGAAFLAAGGALLQASAATAPVKTPCP